MVQRDQAVHAPGRKDKLSPWAGEILSGLRDLIKDVAPHEAGAEAPALLEQLDRLCAVFPADYARMNDLSEVLFSPDSTAYGARTTAIFNRWQGEENGGPSLPAFVAVAMEHFNLPLDGPMARAAMMAAVLSEMPNDLQYHGNEHYRKVMFHTMRLLATHRQLNADSMPVFNDTQMMQMLIAATIHDLGHEGGDNLRDGIYTPGYMEQKAFDMMRPYLEGLDLDREFWGDIETIVFCTDITFFAGDNSPCVRMKKIYRHFFTHDLPEGEDVETMIIGKLRRFEDNRALSLMAMLLHEADIATSSGLSYEQSCSETISIMEERDLKIAGPKVLLKFLIEQLDGCMMTPAAQKLFASEMAVIMQQAEQALLSGVESFYD
jgi:hypothetical protein